MVKICLQCGRPGFNPWVGTILWRRERLSTPVFCPGDFHVLYSPGGHKEMDTTEWLSLSTHFFSVPQKPKGQILRKFHCCSNSTAFLPSGEEQPFIHQQDLDVSLGERKVSSLGVLSYLNGCCLPFVSAITFFRALSYFFLVMMVNFECQTG